MRKITPELTEEISKFTSPETVAKDEAIEVLTIENFENTLRNYLTQTKIVYYSIVAKKKTTKIRNQANLHSIRLCIEERD